MNLLDTLRGKPTTRQDLYYWYPGCTFDGADKGCFGYRFPWVCDKCGPIPEPEYTMTYAGCGYEGFWGPEPEEGENFCPRCGSPDTEERDLSNEYWNFKATKRYRLRRQR